MNARNTEAGYVQLAGALDAIALAILLILVAVRPCLPEVMSYESPSMTRGLDAPTGPLPATTLMFSTAIGMCLLLSIVAGALRGERGPRLTLVWIGVALLAVGGAIATYRAGQKRLAIDGAVGLFGCVLAFPASVRLMRSPWRVRLTATIILATGSVVAVRCIQQVTDEFPATLEYYEQYRGESNATDGEEARGRLHDFEARLRSGAATGYFVHPNVAASYLLLVVMVALGVISDRAAMEGRLAALGLVLPTSAALLACAGLYLCQSKGAGIALGIGVVVWTIGERCAGWIVARPRSVLIGLWGIALMSAFTLVGVGAARGGLPTRSLLYRWQYWRGAAAMISDQGWLGVGPENFGRLFTRYKPVECPEEVQDPHSWVVRMAAEWGVIGLAGMIVVLMGGSVVIAARRTAGAAAAMRGGAVANWALIVCAGMFWIWGANYGDAPTAYLVAMLGTALIIWLPTAWLMGLEPGCGGRFPDRPTTHMMPALVGGAIALLVHAAIDLGLSMPGVAMTFFVVLGMAAAGREGTAAVSRPRPIVASLGAVAIVALLVVATIAIRPVLQTGRRLVEARRAAAPTDFATAAVSSAALKYSLAAATDKRDATAAAELTGLLITRVSNVAECDATAEWIAQIRERDPQNSTAARRSAELYAARFRFSRDPGDLRRSVAAMREAVAAYPTLPAARIALARTLTVLNDIDPAANLRGEAADELERALELDSQRVYVSQPHRLLTDRRLTIEEQIRRLRSGGGQATSRPTD